jgi:hypothetical protein
MKRGTKKGILGQDVKGYSTESLEQTLSKHIPEMIQSFNKKIKDYEQEIIFQKNQIKDLEQEKKDIIIELKRRKQR